MGLASLVKGVLPANRQVLERWCHPSKLSPVQLGLVNFDNLISTPLRGSEPKQEQLSKPFDGAAKCSSSIAIGCLPNAYREVDARRRSNKSCTNRLHYMV